MTIAGFNILACPHCSQLYKNCIIGSMNTYNSKRYSDGYVEGDFNSVSPRIVKCINKNCNTFFHINYAKFITKISREKFDDVEWKDAFYLMGYKLQQTEIQEALNSDFAKADDNESILRTNFLI